MKIKIQNIGLLKEADIQLDGLTVITGPNDSGKSTVGKVLFSLYHGMNFYEKEIGYASVEYLWKAVRQFKTYFKKMNKDKEAKKFAENFLGRMEEFEAVPFLISRRYHKEGLLEEVIDRLKNLINELENGNMAGHEQVREQIQKIKDRMQHINSSAFQIEVKENTIRRFFLNEFSGIINNVYSSSDGRIEIQEDIFQYVVSVKKDEFSGVKKEIDEMINFKDVIFIDTPLILNEMNAKERFMGTGIPQNHKDDLLDKLSNANHQENIIEDTLRNEKISLIDQKIKEVLTGSVKRSMNRFEYEIDGDRFDLTAIASGMKTYSIVRLLLDNGHLNEESLLIIDEPEVHLHPKWQVKFAELLVLLVKELQMKLVLATHSPYFLQALELFSKKYALKEKSHFYLAERQTGGAVLKNIDDCMDETYALLAQPLRDLREMMDNLED